MIANGFEESRRNATSCTRETRDSPNSVPRPGRVEGSGAVVSADFFASPLGGGGGAGAAAADFGAAVAAGAGDDERGGAGEGIIGAGLEAVCGAVEGASKLEPPEDCTLGDASLAGDGAPGWLA